MVIIPYGRAVEEMVTQFAFLCRRILWEEHNCSKKGALGALAAAAAVLICCSSWVWMVQPSCGQLAYCHLPSGMGRCFLDASSSRDSVVLPLSCSYNIGERIMFPWQNHTSACKQGGTTVLWESDHCCRWSAIHWSCRPFCYHALGLMQGCSGLNNYFGNSIQLCLAQEPLKHNRIW